MANTTGKKFGGREKGTPNKATKELRETLSNILSDEIEKVPETLRQLDPKEKLDVLIKLLPYIVPKMQSIEYTDESEPKQGGVVRFVKSSDELDLSNLTYEQLRELAGKSDKNNGN